MTPPPRADRTPLHRQRALDAAVALADAEGIAALSMRNLAGRLGVVPMALYKHVADKEDLLDGMIDTLVASYPDPPPDLAWQAAVRHRVLAARRVLLDHPWARAVIESRRRRTPAVLGYLDTLAGTFLAGGLSADLTHHAMHALGHRVWGFSPEAFDDAAVPEEGGADQQGPDEQTLRRMAAAYPHIATIALDAADGDLARIGAGCDEQYEFEFALDLLLDAFAALHAAGWTSRPERQPRPG